MATSDENDKLRLCLAELDRDIAECLSQIDCDPSQPWSKRFAQLKREKTSIQNTLAQYT
jgi:hypothetical protein